MKTQGAQSQALMLKHKMQDWIGTRKQVQFWLNLSKQPEIEMLDIITWFKSKGLFRSSVMRGLRVIYAYMQNDFEEVLHELPNLKSIVGQGKTDDGLKDDIAELKRLLREATITAPVLPTPPADYPVMKPADGGIRKLAAPTLSMPSFDDDDDELPSLATAKSAVNAAQNLIDSVMGLLH